MAIDWLEHKGEEVSKTSVKAVRNEMLDKMQAYCYNMQYTMNPDIVYRSDRGSKYPRHYAWETDFMDNRTRYPQRAKKFTRCCFFYKLGEEPKDIKDILPCPETDLEWEERDTEED